MRTVDPEQRIKGIANIIRLICETYPDKQERVHWEGEDWTVEDLLKEASALSGKSKSQESA